jgi:endonuclease/exonuclease/phosphatase family metal-dependent hydrolase
VVIFNGSYLALSPRWDSFKSSFAHVTRSGGAMVLSTHEILEARPILSTSGSLVVKIRLSYLGEEMIIWGFDLPSSPTLSRNKLFSSLKEKLSRLNEPTPDLLVGDFNVPRNSHALRDAFPEFRNAFSEAGSGWSGTWPTFLPLWDLDQIRVGSGYLALRYEVITPPVGMHRIQRVILRR